MVSEKGSYWNKKLKKLTDARKRSGVLFSDKALKELRKVQSRWARTTVASWNTSSPERKASCVNPSGIPIQQLYTPTEVSYHDYLMQLGHPGEYPYTRGVYPTMYRVVCGLCACSQGLGHQMILTLDSSTCSKKERLD